MRRDKKAWIGILSLVGLLAPISNSANALSSTTENNLLSKNAQISVAAPKAAFLVSTARSQVTLKKYTNSVSLTDFELI